MILRRLADAIREQNWFTVFIEFMIVVGGIFVGLQVDDWHESRKARADERRYLERLAIEVAENRDGAKQRAEAHERRARTLETVSLYISGTESNPPDTGELVFALCRWHVLPSFRLRTGTYDELVATGNLGLIQSQELRNLLLETQSQHAASRQQTELFGDTIRELAAPLRPYLDWSHMPESAARGNILESDPSSGACRVDLEGIKEHEGSASIIGELYRSQAIFARFRREEEEADQRLLASLNEILDKWEAP